MEDERITFPLLITKAMVVFPCERTVDIEASRNFSINAIKKSQESFNNLILVVSQKKEDVDKPAQEDLFEMATLCQIRSCEEGKEKITAKILGTQRALLHSVSFSEDCYVGSCSLLEPIIENKDELEHLKRKAINAINMLGREIQRAVGDRKYVESLPAESFADYIVSSIQQSFLNTEKSYALLAENNVNRRMELLLDVLADLKSFAELDSSINEKMRQRNEQNQKEYYLREKMRAIKEELGEDPNSEVSEESILKKIEENPYPEYVKAKVKAELHRYEMMPESSLEANLIMNYIETLINVPWYQKTDDNEDLDNVRKVLDEDHYGLEPVKKRIVEYLAVKRMTGNLKAPILCFYGPPGCGKTSLGLSIAKALGRKYYRASLGGVYDEAEIRGHRRTYVGSMPGRIITGMNKCGTVNPVFVLDEIDKLGLNSNHGDPTSALLEVLDPSQNFSFNDNYLEEPYDLSDVLFICTANYLNNIPAPLRDRLELIEVPSYTELEKIKIALGFLIKKQMEANGLKEEDLSWQEEAIKYIIEHYTIEAGVRQLERTIASICRKAVVEIIDHPDIEKPIVINPLKVREYLGVELFEGTKKEKEAQIGVVTGLAYTEAGGDILPIEVTYFEGKGGLVLTGNLGDVMKESATIALDYVRANAEKYNIDPKLFQSIDVHVHVPEGAVPKDGPSAGVALTCAIISCLSHVPASADVAMTGEVTLRGKAFPIGGLREKSLAAMRSGIKKILVPEENKKDVSELPQEVKDGLEIVYITCVDDALSQLLLYPKA